MLLYHASDDSCQRCDAHLVYNVDSTSSIIVGVPLFEHSAGMLYVIFQYSKSLT